MVAQAGGNLRYLRGRLERSVRVSMTWDTLAVMREQLGQAGIAISDDLITKRALITWGCEQIARVAAEGQPMALVNLVLDVEDTAARDLLKRCRLLSNRHVLVQLGTTGTTPSFPEAA